MSGTNDIIYLTTFKSYDEEACKFLRLDSGLRALMEDLGKKIRFEFGNPEVSVEGTELGFRILVTHDGYDEENYPIRVQSFYDIVRSKV